MCLILGMKRYSFSNISLFFRHKHSTQEAIISLVDQITNSYDSRDLDLKNAFDNVNHKIIF